MPDGKLRMPQANMYFLQGRLTRDAELRMAGNGAQVLEFSVAWSRKWKGKDDRDREDKLFLRCSLFNGAERLSRELVKGRPVQIQGELVTEEYEKNGKRESHTRLRATYAQPLDWPSDSNYEPQPQRASTPEPAQASFDDEDIPF